MPAPFYNAIKGTTAGTPGTGAFTPNAAATLCRAWSNVPTGWIGMVLFVDGTAWELCYSYWNGTTLSRASTQLFDSSTGSAVSLTSAATAAMVIQASNVMSNLGTTKFAISTANGSTSTPNVLGMAQTTTTGTNTVGTVGTSNLLSSLVRDIATSVTTANAQAGFPYTVATAVVSTTAGMGGYEFICRFGASTLPTGPRLFVGMTSVSFISNTGEPSALTAHVAAFALDSTDTNIQLLVNSNAGSGTKTDTGIPLALNHLYETRIWTDPGSTTVYGLLIDFDAGTIWTNTPSGTTTDVPTSGAIMMQQPLGGLSSTTGTAFAFNYVGMTLRTGL